MKNSIALRFCLGTLTVSAAAGFAATNDCMFYRIVSTQQTCIIDFDSAGLLTWSNAVPDAACRIESMPDITMASNATLSAEIHCSNSLASIRMPLCTQPTPALLSIYSDGWGTFMERQATPINVPFTVKVKETDPYSDPAQYYGYIHQDDCYTTLLNFTNGATVAIYPEPITNTARSMSGVIFARQSYFRDCYLKTNALSVKGPNGDLPDIMTDELGRYIISNVETGVYTLAFTNQGLGFQFKLTNTEAMDYRDLSFWEPEQMDAPNIYLYPETETNIAVNLVLRNNTRLTESIPAYNEGWNVHVSTNGIIDGTYNYLFYEALAPMPLETRKGWLLDGSDLENEMRQLLSGIGFIGREIDDFVEFWLPLMNGPEWYAVYWNPAEKATTLNITPEPDSLLRAHFVFRPLDRPIQITEPDIEPFTRTGFTVIEWGVVGWPKDSE